jgi:hypothetical protein
MPRAANNEGARPSGRRSSGSAGRTRTVPRWPPRESARRCRLRRDPRRAGRIPAKRARSRPVGRTTRPSMSPVVSDGRPRQRRPSSSSAKVPSTARMDLHIAVDRMRRRILPRGRGLVLRGDPARNHPPGGDLPGSLGRVAVVHPGGRDRAPTRRARGPEFPGSAPARRGRSPRRPGTPRPSGSCRTRSASSA